MTLLTAAILLCAPPETESAPLEWMAGLATRDLTPLGGKIGGRYRYWQAEFEGTLRADDKDIQGTNVDIARSLDLEEEENLSGITAWFGLSGAGRIWLDWWDGTWEGDKILENNVTYAGQTFTVGTNVHTKMEWRALTGLYLFDLPAMPDIGLVQLHLGIGGGFKFLRLHGKLTSPFAEESGTFRAPIPVLGGTARVSFGDYLSAELEAHGLHVESWEGVATGTIYDVSLAAQARYSVFFVGVGYRWFGVRVEDERADIDKVEADLQIRGFFLEGGVSF